MAYRLTKGRKKIPEGWQLIEDVSRLSQQTYL